MRITRCASVVLIVLSIHVSGCDGGDENKPVDLKPADTSQFGDMKDKMMEDMSKNVKGVRKTATPKS